MRDRDGGQGLISTDAGPDFAAVPGASGVNVTPAAPTGSGNALVWADAARGVHLREPAGSLIRSRAMHRVTWVGFASPTDGSAIAGATDAGPALLWHSVDGGDSWRSVAVD